MLKRWFQYPLNLHCSQTNRHIQPFRKIVSIPSEFTLLSNINTHLNRKGTVSIPSEFTLLSNTILTGITDCRFQYPLNLHCSQTRLLLEIKRKEVSIPSEFTLLSNQPDNEKYKKTFQYPLNLHCSQTNQGWCTHTLRFNTL